MQDSPLITLIRRNGPFQVGETKIILPRAFGFCWGVKRALAMVERARESLPANKRMFLLHEIIHNPSVCDRLRQSGLVKLDPLDREWWGSLRNDDTVVVSAFGATIEEEARLQKIGVTVIETTCPSVRRVWARVSTYAEEGFTTILHGRRDHPETRATLSRAVAAGGHYVIVRDHADASSVASFITGDITERSFREEFQDATDKRFDPSRNLKRLGLANQTTMVASESKTIAKILMAAMVKQYGQEKRSSHFQNLGTICQATQQRQDAVRRLAEQPIDFLLVVGGHKSSNTRHLAELAQISSQSNVRSGTSLRLVDHPRRITQDTPAAGLDRKPSRQHHFSGLATKASKKSGRPSSKIRVVHVECPGALENLQSVEHQVPGSNQTERADISWLKTQGRKTIGFTGGASTPDSELGASIAKLLLLLEERLPEIVLAELRLYEKDSVKAAED